MSEARHNEPDLAELADQWLAAKAREKRANKERIAIEQAMLPFLLQKPEGSITTELPSGHSVKITNKINRKLDFRAFSRVRDQIPATLQPIKIKEELDEPGVRWLQNNEPELYALLAPCLTATPAKPGVLVTPPVEG